jgi:hypothetical protein
VARRPGGASALSELAEQVLSRDRNELDVTLEFREYSRSAEALRGEPDS